MNSNKLSALYIKGFRGYARKPFMKLLSSVKIYTIFWPFSGGKLYGRYISVNVFGSPVPLSFFAV